MKTTEDHLLKGRVTFNQPAVGYRTAIDTVLLAASIGAKPGHKVLDMGCGVGGVMLCLGARVPGVMVHGLEIQPELADLAQANIEKNHLGDRLRVFTGDIVDPPAEIAKGGYDFVVANPPFVPQGNGHPPPGDMKRTANFEGDADINQWVGASLRLVRAKGTVVMVHRADRLDHIMAAIKAGRDDNGQGAGDITILPIHPRAGEPANRIIISFRRGVKSPVSLLQGIAVHNNGEAYTPLLDAIVDGGAISLK